ncbi:MAG: hypothetical protein IJ480_11010 [Clostridia bacterium]|nr:hypothetical protein [Clostridia bacterium]
MERLRNWYTIHIMPVIPCLRMHRKGMAYVTLVLALVLLSLDVSQMVWQVSGILEEQAAEGYRSHLICRNITEEQIETLRRTRKNFAKYRDGAFEIGKITPMERAYDTVYDVEILLIRRPKTFYKGDLIVGYSSFLQNYEEYLLTAPGAEMQVTPLYYAQAEYRFSTFVYHVLELLSLRSGEDTVTTILETEARYIVKPLFGLDPDRVSESTVHFARSLLGILCGGAIAVAFAVWLETEHMQYDFAVFSVFGADTRRLTVFLLYKMLFLSLVIQIPCALLTYLLGFCMYGMIVFRIFPGIFLFSMMVILLLVPAVVRLETRFRIRRSVMERLTAEDNSAWMLSPGRSRVFRQERFAWTYAWLNLLRHGKYFAFFISAAVVFSILFRLTAMLVAPPADVPQYTAEFSVMMEYAVYEEQFAPDMAEAGGIPAGQIAADAADAAVGVWYEGKVLQGCRIAAAGNTLYTLYPAAKNHTDAGRAVLLTPEKIPAGTELLLGKPTGRTAAVTDLPEEERRTAYAYENISVTAGAVYPAEETVLYLSWEMYSRLAGERNGETLQRHIRLPETTGWTDAVTYKSAAYTDRFYLRCVDVLPEEVPLTGDYMDVLMDANTIGIRCSREMLDALGYTLGDRVELSDTGKLRLTEKTHGGWIELPELLRHMQFRYTGYTIGAIFVSDSNTLEILTGPGLYESITGIPMGYSTAAIYLPETAGVSGAETDRLWQNLRQTAGEYYEVYIRNHDTAARRELYRSLHRPVEAGIISVCTAVSMGLILWELLGIFDTRRQAEFAVLRACGGETRQIRSLRWGCIWILCGAAAGVCTAVFLIL